MSDSRYFSKPFIICLIVSTVIIFSFMIFGAYSGNNVSIEEANTTLTDIEGMRLTATWDSILINNGIITLISFIPIVGSIYMAFIQFNTGFIAGNLSKALGIDYRLYVSALFTSFTGLMEYSAYIFIGGESMMIVYCVFNGEFKERFVKQSWKTLILGMVLLVSAAVYEAWHLGRL